jgi:LPS-assembly protein
LNSQFSRIFGINVLNWEKIRHEIKPEIKYSYIPDVKQDNIPDFIPTLTPAVDRIALSEENIIGEQNALAWSITNTFTAKLRDENGGYSYLDFLRLKVFQSYDNNEAKRNMAVFGGEKRPFSDIGIEFDLSPHKYLSFTARNKYSIYDGWRETNYDLHISDSRGDRVTVGYRYTLGSIEQINVSIKAVLTKNIEGVFISARDQFHSRTVENTVGLIYRSQCWAVGVDFTKTDTDSRIMLKFQLPGLIGSNF